MFLLSLEKNMTTRRQVGWPRLLLVLTVVPCCWSLQVSIQNKLYKVAKGNEITLTCDFNPAVPIGNNFILTWEAYPDVSGDPLKTVATYFLNNPVDISPTYEGRVFMEVNMEIKSSTLQFTEVTIQDSRNYQCSVKIPGDDEGQTADTTNLLVLVPPSPPVCTLQGKAEYFHDITLTCKSEEGSPLPVHQWTSYSIENIQRQFPPKTTQEDGVLSLFNISRETSGYFICKSENEIGSKSCNFSLAVMPSSMNMGSTAGIIGGVIAGLLVLGIVIFFCCRRKGKKEYYAEDAQAEMEFQDRDDAEVPPSPPVCTLQGKAEYFHDITLTCKSEEGSPLPVHQWTSYSIENIQRQFPPKTTQEDGVLSLFNISRETSGYFICKSENEIGSKSCNFSLAVMPSSMNMGSTAGIIGGVIAGLLVLGIVIFFCCRRKGKKEYYAEDAQAEMEFQDRDDAEGGKKYLDDVSNSENKQDNQNEDKNVVPKSIYGLAGAGLKIDDDQYSYKSSKERDDAKGSRDRLADHPKCYGSRDHLDDHRRPTGSRDRLDDDHERYGSRDHLDHREPTGSRDRLDNRERNGSRDHLNDHRERYGSRDRLDDNRDRYGSRDHLDNHRDRYGSRDRLEDHRDGYGSRDRLDDHRDRYGSRDRLDDHRDRYGSRDRLDDHRERHGSRDRLDYS
ncbi:uncharacterized protein ACNS7B_023884 [Menidia menidia]